MNTNKSGQTYWRPEGRHKSDPKIGQINWVRYRFGYRPLLYRIRHKLRRAIEGLPERIKNIRRVSKHHNKALPKRDFARRRT